MTTAATYTRLSKEEEARVGAVSSLEIQHDACCRLIAAHEHDGWKLGPTYTDNGRSGGDSNRPGYQQLLADAKAGKFQVLVVHRLDRFTRSLVDFVDAIQVLEQAGVAFASVAESIDTSTPYGRMSLNMLAVFAQFERERIAERITTKLQEKKRKGETYCSRLYGHRGDKGKCMQAVPKEQQAIRVMQELSSSGAGPTEIARTLTSRGYAPPKGRTWHPSTVLRILERVG